MATEEKTSLVPLTNSMIMEKIYWIRGHKVMLDKDLAELYGYETKRLNEQVRRNKERFPASFMFQLTAAEVEDLRSHFATANVPVKTRTLPYAFTEHGVLMLANVLKSETAIKVSLYIIEVFVKMREMILSHKDIIIKLQKLEKQQSDHSTHIKQLYQYIKAFMTEKQKPRQLIGFKIRAMEQ